MLHFLNFRIIPTFWLWSGTLPTLSPKRGRAPKLCISKAGEEEPSAAKRARTDMRLDLKLDSLPFKGVGLYSFQAVCRV